MSRIFNDLRRGLENAIRYARGERDAQRVTIISTAFRHALTAIKSGIPDADPDEIKAAIKYYRAHKAAMKRYRKAKK